MKRSCCYKKKNMLTYNCECTFGCIDCKVHFICRVCRGEHREIPSKVKDQQWEKQKSEKYLSDLVAGILKQDPKATELESKTRKELEVISGNLRKIYGGV